MPIVLRRSLFWVLLPLLLTGCSGCGKHWEVVGELSTYCSPAIRDDPKGSVFMAVVDTLGRVAVRSSEKPGVWSDWVIIADGAEVRTSPQLHYEEINTFRRMYVYYRGQENNLYRVVRNQDDWQDPVPLTSDGSVNGRVSISHLGIVIHCLYVAGPTSVVYRCGHQYNFPVKHEFSGAIEGTLTTASATGTSMLMVVRFPTKVTVHTSTSAMDWAPQEIAARNYPFGTCDISNVVHLQKHLAVPSVTYDHHVLVDARTGPADTAGREPHLLQHWMISDDPGNAAFRTLRIPVEEYATAEGHTLSSLQAYRNKLVALWRTAGGKVRNARLDDADPSLPWITRESIRYALDPDDRPALCDHNHRDHLTREQLRAHDENYGNDVFAAASQRGRVMFQDLTMDWFQEVVDDEFMLFHSGVNGGCAGDGEPDAPIRLGAASGIRTPFITELGFGTWLLPEWFMRGQYRRVAGQLCTANPDWQTKGRTPPPCGTARMPVIMKEAGAMYFCAGVWMNYDSEHTVYWEELGHYLTFGLGICNDCPMPAAENTLTRIPLNARRSAYTIFQEGTSVSCGDLPRCPGFTGVAGNYDLTGREHSFIYAVDRYIHGGEQMRQWIQQDLADGNTLLRRKYNWIRDEIFHGVEF